MSRSDRSSRCVPTSQKSFRTFSSSLSGPCSRVWKCPSGRIAHRTIHGLRRFARPRTAEAAPRGRHRVMSICCFTQWLASSLGVLSPKSSPSFELSKVRSQVDKKLDRYFNHISVLRCIRPQFIVREWKPPCSHEITVLAPLRTSDDTSCNKEVRREAALYLIEDSSRSRGQ